MGRREGWGEDADSGGGSMIYLAMALRSWLAEVVRTAAVAVSACMGASSR